MKTILLQLAEERWTKDATHQACALARNSQAKVILLRFMQVTHISYLGTDIGYISPKRREYCLIDDCAATAEDYGVELVVEHMQCASALDATMQAVDLFDADLVFAYVPKSRIPYWRRFQLWRLSQWLGSKVITLDQPLPVDHESPLTINEVTLLRNQPLDDNQLPVR